MNRESFIKTLNQWGQKEVPFLFYTDFEEERLWASPLSEINPGEILFDFQGVTNFKGTVNDQRVSAVEKAPLSFEKYKLKFDLVMKHLDRGDSFLTNLTVKTRINMPSSLRSLFPQVKARYKMWVKNEFLFFSPETFVRISGNKIYCNPMKGTIDASQPDAEKAILGDLKELSEHITIVDLIRNDLSQVADKVEVTRFRYVEEIKTSDKNLLQVSSEIVGEMRENPWPSVGSTLMSLMPAGSISGAPKKKTVEIIREAEGGKRGFYTGVAGIFDGKSLDSCVMIRFIEERNNIFHYRSGGGITTQSDVYKEYQEAIDKVYVPID